MLPIVTWRSVIGSKLDVTVCDIKIALRRNLRRLPDHHRADRGELEMPVWHVKFGAQHLRSTPTWSQVVTTLPPSPSVAAPSSILDLPSSVVRALWSDARHLLSSIFYLLSSPIRQAGLNVRRGQMVVFAE